MDRGGRECSGAPLNPMGGCQEGIEMSGEGRHGNSALLKLLILPAGTFNTEKSGGIKFQTF